MAVNLSVKNVPDEVVAWLRERAKRHHRSLQGELLAIIEEAVRAEWLSVGELRKRVDALGLRTGPEAQAMIRELRDAG